MFGFFKKRTVVKYVDRTVTRYETSTEDAAMRKRVESFIERAENEYVRLVRSLDDDRERVANGGYIARDLTDRKLGKLDVIAQSLALIKGTSSIVETFQLDKKASERRNDRFPVTSLLAQSSPIYVD
jgi:hypothetical protein